MIKTVFTLANNIAKHFRFSPTSIIEGREQQHLETLINKKEETDLRKIAQQQAFNARIQNTSCPFEKEKQQIVKQFADPEANLTFADAWLKLDDVEQRKSDDAYFRYYKDGAISPRETNDRIQTIGLTQNFMNVNERGRFDVVDMTDMTFFIMKVEVIAIVVAFLVYSVDSHSHHDHNHDHGHQHEHQHHQHQYHHEHHHEHHHDHQHEEDHHDFNQLIADMTPSQKQQALLNFFTSLQKQVDEWVYLPRDKPLPTLLETCQMQSNTDYLLNFYIKLATLNTTITKQHIDLIFKQFKTVKIIPQLFSCLVKQRTIENHYLQEKKKLKYMAQMVNRYPSQGKDIFPEHTNFTVIGQKVGKFFKALFEYYYLQVLNPSETLSTEFLRALTVRSPVFQHEDIAFCIAIDSVGRLSEQLEDIDINNVYIKIPEVYDSLRFLKLKDNCKDSHNKMLINNLHTALEGLDMFKIMYNEYEPFVEIAAEKMVQTQIRLLARKFSEIIANRKRYLAYSKQDLQGEL